MTSALIPLGWALAYLYGFWLLYVLIMGFYRAYLAKRLTKPALVLAMPALVTGYLVDLVANWTIASLWFWEWPQTKPLWPLRWELPDLVTTRLSRYIAEPGNSLRKHEAKWLCENLLDYFDPNGSHCSSPPKPPQ